MTLRPGPPGRRELLAGGVAGITALALPDATLASSGGLTPVPTYTNGTLSPAPDVALNDIAYRIVAEGDDLLVVGAFTSAGGAAHDSIVRLIDGTTRDPTLLLDVNARFLCAAVQPDGMIIVGGIFTTIDGTPASRIARIAPDGAVDTSFTASADGNVWGVAIQDDGAIVLVGHFSSVNGTARNGIARVSASGALDTAFDPDAGVGAKLYEVTLQSDGRILVGGEFNTIGGVSRPMVARLNADGSRDSGFTPPTPSGGYVASVRQTEEGDILIGGTFTALDGGAPGRIARLGPSGMLDVGFTPSLNNFVWVAEPQRDGSILLGGGFTTVNTASRPYLARVLADGTLDVGFAPAPDGIVRGIRALADGSVVVCGQFTSIAGASRVRLARLA